MNHSVKTCVDYSVTKESFDLKYDEEYDMLVTSPAPNAHELKRYYESDAYISHTDSTETLIEKIYQIVKNHTINQKIKLINALNTEEKNILDIGCGTGDFLLACSKNKWEIKGIEPNANARKISQNKMENFNSSSDNIIEDIETFGNDQFDVITMWHVLEHVPNLEEYIQILKKLLKPNGTLIIAVPNYKSFDANYYGMFWAAYDVPRHLWHFSKTSIKKLFGNQNMNVEKMIPMKFDSFYVSLLSEKYKNGKSNFLNAFKVGLQSNLKAKKDFEYSSIIYLIKNK